LRVVSSLEHMTTESSPTDTAPQIRLGSRLVREKRAPQLILLLSLAVTLWGWRVISMHSASRREPLVVLALGLTISVLLFVIVRSIAGTQARAVALATTMTAELRESRERFRAVTDTAMDAIISTDASGQITYFNPGAEHMFGYAAREASGQPVTLLMPERLQETHRPELQRFLSTGQSPLAGQTLELTGLHRTEGEFPVELSVASWTTDRGTFFTAILRDITARKNAEEALRRANEELEARVTERTAALDASVQEVRQLNEQLEERVVERTAQLEAATKELEAFSYSVSHDLRAPLRHVHGFTKLLRERVHGLDETATRYVTIISNAAAKMATLIDDLLALSRTGRAELRVQEVDLKRLVTEISADCAQEAKNRRIVWKLGDLPYVTGDGALLRIAFVNLLSNAVKFTARRDEAVIEVDATAGERGEVIVRVKDNGAGFDPRYAHKLFGVFQRLHRDDEFEGTGIGLATVQRVVHRHGGRVWAEGEVDRGATLYIALKGIADTRHER